MPLVNDGDQAALDKLMPLVIDEVRDLARRALALESPGHTLQPTELVDEVYLRLIHGGRTGGRTGPSSSAPWPS